MAIDLEVTENDRGAAKRAAELIAAAGQRAVADHGSFSFAMSGGRSPWSMLAILGDMEEMPWRETELFQVDERVASPGSDDRNLTHMVLGLSMDHQSALRPMPVIGRRCHELRVLDGTATWRIVYRTDPDAIVILAVFAKTTRATPGSVIDNCVRRLKEYDDA